MCVCVHVDVFTDITGYLESWFSLLTISVLGLELKPLGLVAITTELSCWLPENIFIFYVCCVAKADSQFDLYIIDQIDL